MDRLRNDLQHLREEHDQIYVQMQRKQIESESMKNQMIELTQANEVLFEQNYELQAQIENHSGNSNYEEDKHLFNKLR